MCFPKPPKPPAASSTGSSTADPALQRQRIQVEEDNAVIKAENKDARMEDQLALLQGRIGRASLFSGGRGGAGYAAPLGRSLFVTNGAQPSAGPIPSPGPGRTPRPRPLGGGGGRAHPGSNRGSAIATIGAGRGPAGNVARAMTSLFRRTH
jgi:hypothetical protein